MKKSLVEKQEHNLKKMLLGMGVDSVAALIGVRLRLRIHKLTFKQTFVQVIVPTEYTTLGFGTIYFDLSADGIFVPVGKPTRRAISRYGCKKADMLHITRVGYALNVGWYAIFHIEHPDEISLQEQFCERNKIFDVEVIR